MIITRTPLRVSLIGGATDMPVFYTKHVGAVVSFAISKYVYVSLNRKFDKSIRVSYSQTENVENIDDLKHDLARETLRYFRYKDSVEVTSVSDIPGEGSGLGSSSAFTIGLANALGHGTHPGILAERAFDIEANFCHHPIGKQDVYASAYGGMNFMTFHGKKVEVKPMYYSDEMQKHFLLLWTGITRPADNILKQQKNNFENGDTMAIGRRMADLAYKFYTEYVTGMSIPRMGGFLQENWELKVRLALISSSQIDEWYALGMEHGAYGGKLCGAGGGGFLFFLAPPMTHNAIIQATGLRKVDFKIEPEGSKVIYNG
jgi:D-glycero-alpha-D-manno-heptose-7-phosphate kinase